MAGLHASVKAEMAGILDMVRVQNNRIEDVIEAVRNLQAGPSPQSGRSAYADAPAPGGIPNPSFGTRHDYG
eukprot:12136577-Alexandrium_andersonii.AAC.1